MAEERIGTARSTWEGPRWAGIESYLRNLAWDLNLEIELQVEKGWIRESGRVKVNGPESKLRLFMKTAEDAMTAYNME